MNRSNKRSAHSVTEGNRSIRLTHDVAVARSRQARVAERRREHRDGFRAPVRAALRCGFRRSGRKRLATLPVTGLTIAMLAGCSWPLAPPPPATVVPPPAVYRGGGIAEAVQPREWWRAFRDPALDRVVAAVLDANADLAVATARAAQARANARIAGASSYPLARPALTGAGAEGPSNAGIGAQLAEVGLDADQLAGFGIELPRRLGVPAYSIGAEFAWETDFWGRNRNIHRAAVAEREATEADLLAARIAVAAETVASWIELGALRRQRTLAAETVRTLEETERLIRTRYVRGLADAGARHEARRNLRTAEADRSRLDARLAEAEGRLWMLLGGYRAELANLLPEAPPVALTDVPSGLPADLLSQRPDVAAARRRLEAASATLGVRRAELLPSLSFAGTIGLTGAETSVWFDPDQWFRNLSANLLGPVFQGALLQARAELAQARVDEAAAAYRNAVVTSVNEVETALAGWEAGRRRHALLAAAATAAHDELELRRELYASGLAEYSEVLASGHTRTGAVAALVAAERDLGQARLALHRALGGAWTRGDATGFPAAKRDPNASAGVPAP